MTKWRRLIGIIFNACDKICVRDSLSATSIRADFPAMGDKVKLAGDLAFRKLRPFAELFQYGTATLAARTETSAASNNAIPGAIARQALAAELNFNQD